MCANFCIFLFSISAIVKVLLERDEPSAGQSRNSSEPFEQYFTQGVEFYGFLYLVIISEKGTSSGTVNGRSKDWPMGFSWGSGRRLPMSFIGDRGLWQKVGPPCSLPLDRTS